MPHPFVCVAQLTIYYTGEIRGVREPLKAMFPASVNVGAQITSGGEVVILNPPNPYAQSNDKYPRKYPENDITGWDNWREVVHVTTFLRGTIRHRWKFP